MPAIKYFWDLVDKTPGHGPTGDCWIWTGAKLKILSTGRGGYGTFRGGDNKVLAHREAYRLHFGEIPEGKIVCHKCDVRLCCNPEHLFLGTYSDNTKDMISKKRDDMRNRKGINSPVAKLTEETVLKAREMRSLGYMYKDISSALGIHPRTVWHVVNKTVWKHI